jgi:hypothetical protein
MVVALLGVVMLISHAAMHSLMRGERRADRESTRALLEAQVLEVLLQDVRSSVSVCRLGDGEWRISRYVCLPSGLESREVVWRTDGRTRVTRHQDGESVKEWSLAGLGDPGETAFRLKLERLSDDTVIP